MAATTNGQILEREAEILALRSLLDDAADGRGRVLLVESPAGTGKSTLIALAGELARDRDVQVLTASGAELERGFAFGAMRQLFEPLLAGASAGERERLLDGAAAPAAWVLDAPADAASRGEGGFAAMHGIYWLTANAATERPLLMTVDDVHWADESSVRALHYLARRVADIPVAAVVAMRPDEPGAPAELLDELRGATGVTTIAPRALSPDAVADLVRRRVPAADAALVESFHDVSAGNPLYLTELLRTFAEGDVLPSPEAVHAAGVPSLGDRLMRRIARLGDDAPALATAMAVLGDGERLATAATLAGMDEDVAAAVALRLRRIEVLAREDPFAFVHPLVRRSVYDSLSVSERDAAHAAAGGLLRDAGASAEAVAAHFAQLRPSGSEDVATTLLAAARDAIGRAAPDAAIRALRRALEEEAPAPPRPTLLFELGQAEMLVRDHACVPHIQEAYATEEDPDRKALYGIVLAELLGAAAMWEAGVAIVDELMASRDGVEHELMIDIATFHAALSAYDSRLVDRFDRDRPWFEELAAGDTLAARTMSAVLAAVTGMRGGDPTEVIRYAERAIEPEGLVPDRSGRAWATIQVIGGLQAVDEYERADEITVRLEAEGRRIGSMYAVVSGAGFRGIAACRRGDLLTAEGDLRVIITLILDSGMSMWISHMFHAYIDALLERPSLEDIAVRMETIELEPAFLASFAGAMLLEARGRRHLARGNREAAVADLRAAGEAYAPMRITPAHTSWRSALALALGPEDGEEARALAAEEVELAKATSLVRPYGIALRGAGLLEPNGAGLDLLRESVELLDGSVARLELARSRFELGAALRRLNRRVEAREELTAAMDLAHRCGAVQLVERADEELHAAGARPRRAASTGVDALTASELRVAKLAADGRSNLEIAQHLYISVKTVDTHLTRAYAKLGLSGQGARRGIAATLERDGG